MPVIKSAKKRARQAEVKQARNYNMRTLVRKSIRKVADAVKAGDKKEATKVLAMAYKSIDTASKKKVLHKNTAARRKSSLAGMVATLAVKKSEAKEAKEAKAE